MGKTKKTSCWSHYSFNFTISNKTVISLSHEDQVLWPVYITIDNLDAKTRWSENLPGTLLLGSLSIVHKQVEDLNNKDRDLNVKIY